MEDILSSIRRVIARDEAPGARDVRAALESDDILDLHEEEEEELAPAPAPVIPTEDELVSAASASAARQSLEALTAAVTPVAAVAAPAPAGRTMEEVVLDAIRPMLKDWLDTNLPGMVETMVAKEISRIVGKKP